MFFGQLELFDGFTMFAIIMIPNVMSITINTNNNTTKVLPNLLTVSN